MIRLFQIAVALVVVYNVYPLVLNFVDSLNAVSTALNH